MKESFLDLFKKFIKKSKMYPGSIIKGKVISINKDIVTIDSGLKSESYIPLNQFYDKNGNLEINVGDKVDLFLDSIEDGFGETLLSREKAKKQELWKTLNNSYKDNTTVTGTINGKVKGGFTVEINGIRAFLPGSLVDVKPIKDSNFLEGKELEFKVIKIDQQRNNIVVSRKAVIEVVNEDERNKLYESLYDGNCISGIVKNITDYGAFIDLGGVDGLLHITDITWRRIKHPNEILSIGDEIKVKIIKFDKSTNRVSLGLKQLSEDPWSKINEKYSIGMKVKGRVTNITDYGCFVEITDGIEGLVHISEMDWTDKNVVSSEKVRINEIVKVMILNIDKSRRRISLGIKQCFSNPWEKFNKKYNIGDEIEGSIKSITDFGIFIKLDYNLTGLIHISDISWANYNEKTFLKNYKKGCKLKSIILQIDIEKERISLGLKQLSPDSIEKYEKIKREGNILDRHIIKINKLENIAYVNLDEEFLGIINLNDKEKKYIKKNNIKLKEKKHIKVKIIDLDKKLRTIYLSSIIEEKNKPINVMKEAFKSASLKE
ncbi:MAG: 30S ribosomal protein S1 [Enterobacteriaceae bacterium]